MEVSISLLTSSVWLCRARSIHIDTCTGNTFLRICIHTCARTKTACFRQSVMGAGSLGGSMRLSVTGHNALGYVRHVSEDTSNRSSILRLHLRRTSAITTPLDLRRYRCPIFETCARKNFLDNLLATSALCVTKSLRPEAVRALGQKSVLSESMCQITWNS